MWRMLRAASPAATLCFAIVFQPHFVELIRRNVCERPPPKECSPPASSSFSSFGSILLTPAVKDGSGAVESRLRTGIVSLCLIAWVIFITAKRGCLWDTRRDQLFSPTAFMPSDWNVMKSKWNDSQLVPYHRKWVTHIVYLYCILRTYLTVIMLNNYLRHSGYNCFSSCLKVTYY